MGLPLPGATVSHSMIECRGVVGPWRSLETGGVRPSASRTVCLTGKVNPANALAAKRLRTVRRALRTVRGRASTRLALHTMYIDKPMRGHGLMQAIARVNRVFKDKPGGLVVDYLGLAHELKEALATYTESGGSGRAALDQDEAVALMLEKHEVCRGLFDGFEWSKWTTGGRHRSGWACFRPRRNTSWRRRTERIDAFGPCELSQAFALAVPHPDALGIRDDVAFFQAGRAPGNARPEGELDHAVRQIISRAVAPGGVVDIFTAAGLERPDISILWMGFSPKCAASRSAISR
jgi:Type I restriction enzyme HindI endonuclease subunit-like, C-terminal/UvrB domain 3